jgi:hypothetical protein
MTEDEEHHEYVGPTMVRNPSAKKHAPQWVTTAGPWELRVVVRCEHCKGRGPEDSCYFCGNTGTIEVRRNKP